MKICFPLKDDKALDSRLSTDLLTASYVMIFNTASNDYKVHLKDELIKLYSTDSIIKALQDEGLDGIVVTSIKPMALKALRDRGIKVFQACSNSLKENIYMIEHNSLTDYTQGEYSQKSACSGTCSSCGSLTCSS